MVLQLSQIEKQGIILQPADIEKLQKVHKMLFCTKRRYISDAHAPTKTVRLKVRSNTWITRDIVKMMYDRDRIHELAVKRKDTVFMEKYRKMRNTITDIIKNRKKEYFSEVSNSLRSSPRTFWSELNTMIPKINMKSLPKDMGAKDFNIYFKNVPDVITSSFTDDSTLL